MTITLISHPECVQHDPGPWHPESPMRLHAINERLIDSGFGERLVHVEAPQATREQLLYVHDKKYIDSIFQSAPKEGRVSIDADTVMNSHTLSAALRAAGAVVKGVDLVLNNNTNSVFCNVRPPGHHAEQEAAMGFCFFNNIAIGVAHALNKYHLKRIAIVDFDVHRGNGTENIFKHNKKVLICSSYEFFLYPHHISQPNADNIIYIPLEPGSSGKEFRREISRYGLTKIDEFAPELIFFSAGFDAHKNDSISSLKLNESDYYWVTKQVKEIADRHCQGRIISVLEGGYALDVLGECVLAHLKGLLTEE
jgi:acetoin utilization deacetylase AcuC-like enzyme